MSLHKELLEKVRKIGFKNFIDVESKEVNFESINADLYHNNKALLMIKVYDNWLSLKESWEIEQISILKLLKENPQFSSRSYFFLILDNFDIKEDFKLDVPMLERDERICKKYVITSSSDFLRIPIINKLEFEHNPTESYEKVFYKKLLSVLESDGKNISPEIIVEVDKYFTAQEVEE
jgi:hypothetical protein